MHRLASASRTLGGRLLEGAAVAGVVGLPFTFLLGLVATNWEPLHRFDTSVADAATTWLVDHPRIVDLLELVAVVFAPMTFYISAAIAAAWLWIRGARRLAAWVAVAAATGSALGVLMKTTVERGRPYIEDPLAHAPGYSFPSGHALNSALGCAILLLAFLPVLHGRVASPPWSERCS
jgi:undecaprenyl-diphosphatase